jgi:hypothetical protein
MENTPTLAGFIAFCRGVVGISVEAMPDESPGFQQGLDFAQLWIPLTLAQIQPPIYTLAVYNWGASLVLQFQQDQPGQVFFTNARSSFGVSNFLPGVINSASNDATSQSMTIGVGLQNLTLTDLQRSKDPYGRAALAILQDLGTMWGLS